MSTEVEKKTEETKNETKFQKLMKIAEFRMLFYVIPVGLVVLVLALLLGK
jgi:hypothetical protein